MLEQVGVNLNEPEKVEKDSEEEEENKKQPLHESIFCARQCHGGATLVLQVTHK